MRRAGVRRFVNDQGCICKPSPDFAEESFDRLLIAQAMVEDLVLLTGDRQIEPYDIRIEWAS